MTDDMDISPASASPSDSPYYDCHVFICVNRRDPGRACCAASGAEDALAHAKARVREPELRSHDVRVNASGCLGRCELGPTVVVYPQGIWYTYVDDSDIDEIIDSHVRLGVPVERLRLRK